MLAQIGAWFLTPIGKVAMWAGAVAAVWAFLAIRDAGIARRAVAEYRADQSDAAARKSAEIEEAVRDARDQITDDRLFDDLRRGMWLTGIPGVAGELSSKAYSGRAASVAMRGGGAQGAGQGNESGAAQADTVPSLGDRADVESRAEGPGSAPSAARAGIEGPVVKPGIDRGEGFKILFLIAAGLVAVAVAGVIYARKRHADKIKSYAAAAAGGLRKPLAASGNASDEDGGSHAISGQGGAGAGAIPPEDRMGSDISGGLAYPAELGFRSVATRVARAGTWAATGFVIVLIMLSVAPHVERLFFPPVRGELTAYEYIKSEVEIEALIFKRRPCRFVSLHARSGLEDLRIRYTHEFGSRPDGAFLLDGMFVERPVAAGPISVTAEHDCWPFWVSRSDLFEIPSK